MADKKDEVPIKLDWNEVLVAANVGVLRHMVALRRDLKPGNFVGFENAWTLEIEGAQGELAVANHLSCYWAWNIGYTDRRDVGGYQVKTNCSRRLDDLIIQPKNAVDDIYIGVLSFCPDFYITGWINWTEALKKKYPLSERVPGRAAHFIPRSALEPMATLQAARLGIAQTDNFLTEFLGA